MEDDQPRGFILFGRRRMLVFMARALSAILAVLAYDSAMADALPSSISDAANEAITECREFGGGNPQPSRDFIQTTDFNQDGRTDYLVDLAELNCVGAQSYFCGSGGCTLTIFVSSGQNWRKAFEDIVQSWKVVPNGDQRLLWVGLHGSSCGRVGAEPCEKLLSYANGGFVEQH